MEHELVGRYPGGERHVELSPGGNVEVHPLLVGEPRHGSTQERLRCVGDSGPKRIDRFTTTVPKVLLVIDERRGAELDGEIKHAAPTNVENAVNNLGGIGEQTGGQWPHGLHRFRSRNTQQAERNPKTDLRRAHQRKTSLGERRRHAIAHHVAVVVEAV